MGEMARDETSSLKTVMGYKSRIDAAKKTWRSETQQQSAVMDALEIMNPGFWLGKKSNELEQHLKMIDQQMKTKSLGFQEIGMEDITDEMATRKITRPGHSFWENTWESVKFYGLFWDQDGKLRNKKRDLAVQFMKDQEENNKVFKQWTKEQSHRASVQLKIYQNELLLSAHELNRTRQRMLAPTI